MALWHPGLFICRFFFLWRFPRLNLREESRRLRIERTGVEVLQVPRTVDSLILSVFKRFSECQESERPYQSQTVAGGLVVSSRRRRFRCCWTATLMSGGGFRRCSVLNRRCDRWRLDNSFRHRYHRLQDWITHRGRASDGEKKEDGRLSYCERC